VCDHRFLSTIETDDSGFADWRISSCGHQPGSPLPPPVVAAAAVVGPVTVVDGSCSGAETVPKQLVGFRESQWR